MLQQLINHSPDIEQLIKKGYEIEYLEGFLLVHHIPYVNNQKETKYGTLVTSLIISGGKTQRPDDHVIHFHGDCPCDNNGIELTKIIHERNTKQLANSITVNFSFSSKPPQGYNDYYEKISTYSTILSSFAKAIDDSVTEFTFKSRDCVDPTQVFRYLDTNSTRGEINMISSKLVDQRIAIIGLGGTGSYILDFVSKNPVKEIHLYDSDYFLQHNAFRAPGAANYVSFESLLTKVDYYRGIYDNIHKNIIAHNYKIDESRLNELVGMNFVFICIDDAISKKVIVDSLISSNTAFIDVGMGVENVNNSLIGTIRVTSVTGKKNDYLNKHINFTKTEKDEYSKNIQIAELNALNAAMAVIKWKKHLGFYLDHTNENTSLYTINTNSLISDDYDS